MAVAAPRNSDRCGSHCALGDRKHKNRSIITTAPHIAYTAKTERMTSDAKGWLFIALDAALAGGQCEASAMLR